MESLNHKQGDTLTITGTWTDSSGVAIDLTGYTIASQVRVVTGTTFVDTLTATVVNTATGSFSLSATATQTSSWPVTHGQYTRTYCDIQFSKAGVVVSSDTFEIVVLLGITQ